MKEKEEKGKGDERRHKDLKEVRRKKTNREVEEKGKGKEIRGEGREGFRRKTEGRRES